MRDTPPARALAYLARGRIIPDSGSGGGFAASRHFRPLFGNCTPSAGLTLQKVGGHGGRDHKSAEKPMPARVSASPDPRGTGPPIGGHAPGDRIGPPDHKSLALARASGRLAGFSESADPVPRILGGQRFRCKLTSRRRIAALQHYALGWAISGRWPDTPAPGRAPGPRGAGRSNWRA